MPLLCNRDRASLVEEGHQQVALLREEPTREWDAFVAASARAVCYHQAGWRTVIERSFGIRTFYLYARDSNGMINGILPLAQMKSRLFGNFLVSLPYFNYGGVCAADASALRSLVSEAVELGAELDVRHLELRHTENLLPDMPQKTSKVTMRLTLPTEAEPLWRSFPSKLRSQINRPQKEGMTIKIGGAELLDGFYSVFARNMRDLGTPVYGRLFFENIMRAFPESTWICTVFTKEAQPAASGFLVGFRDVMEVPWASSIQAYNRSSPNMLLYWSMLKHACDLGYRTFDFGRSTRDGGTFRFKTQWGAEPEQLYWHYWVNGGGEAPEVSPSNPKYRLPIEIWKRLPVSLTRLVGPHIVKNIP